MKLHVENIERAYLLSRMRITRLNSVSATLLIHLYKIFTRPYMDYACMAQLYSLSQVLLHFPFNTTIITDLTFHLVLHFPQE